MYQLVIQDDEGKTTIVPLIRDEITIGRKEGNTIRLTEKNVSRRHARILRSNGSIAVEDLDSYNGVTVNGNKVQGRCAVAETDRVRIGDYVLELRKQGIGGVVEGADDAETVPHPTKEMTQAEAPVSASSVATAPMVPTAEGGKQEPARARLVVVSKNFAGREFALAEASVVVGRTEDNPVSLDHRSISRHHAKLVLDGDRWSIVDLESSNGVRVNGERYNKIELRRGDFIDLGHVRLRFVAAGEDFVFERDAQIVDIEGGGSRALSWVAGFVVLLGIAAIALVFIPGEKNGSETPKVTATESPKVEGTKPPELAAGSNALAVEALDAGNQRGPIVRAAAERLRSAQLALDAKNWREAQTNAQALLEIDPANAEAKELLEEAKAEAANQRRLENIIRGARKAHYSDVFGQWKQIPANSVYKPEAKPHVERLATRYTASVVATAKKYAARRRCDKLAALASKAGKVWAPARAEVSGVPCEPKSQSSQSSTSSESSKSSSTKNTKKVAKPDKPGPSSSGLDGISVDKLLSMAQDAVLNNKNARAEKYATAILKRSPGDERARLYAAMAACNMRKKSRATRHAKRLSAGKLGALRQHCLARGVELP